LARDRPQVVDLGAGPFGNAEEQIVLQLLMVE